MFNSSVIFFDTHCIYPSIINRTRATTRGSGHLFSDSRSRPYAVRVTTVTSICGITWPSYSVYTRGRLYTWNGISTRPFHAREGVYIIDQLTTARRVKLRRKRINVRYWFFSRFLLYIDIFADKLPGHFPSEMPLGERRRNCKRGWSISLVSHSQHDRCISRRRGSPRKSSIKPLIGVRRKLASREMLAVSAINFDVILTPNCPR